MKIDVIKLELILRHAIDRSKEANGASRIKFEAFLSAFDAELVAVIEIIEKAIAHGPTAADKPQLDRMLEEAKRVLAIE
jgi:hypothetical protein